LERKLSLFQIDIAEEAGDGQKPAFFLAKELKRRGYPIHYVVRRGSPVHRKAVEAGLPVFLLKGRVDKNASSILRLYWAMKRRGCRLVDVHDIRSMALGFAAASLAKVPLRIISRQKEITIKGEDILHRKYIQLMDAIIVVSDEMKKKLVDGGVDPRLIQVIPNGIDFSSYTMEASKDYLRQEFSFGPDDFLAGMVFHAADEKRFKDLLGISKCLKELAPQIKLIILGEGRMEFHQGRQMKEIWGEDLFMCLGFRQHLPQIIHSLDVFVLVSDQKEVSPILLDAMACRLPVIATKSEGINKVIADGKTGLVVPSGRPKSIASAIIKMCEDQSMAHQMGQRGHEIVCRKFSIDTMASRIIDLYEDLAQKKGIKLQRTI
jgi:glycosyltransferase involved in cell wall biosynthesis